jgi:calcineurin-like phosphoesterase family protein
MPGLWFSSDLHFAHANVISYCNRPFRTADEMDLALIERWNATVAPDDVVVVLGDVAMGQLADSLSLVGLLHGTKVLVPGNHDRCWVGHSARKRAHWDDRYLEAGFSTILHDPQPVELANVTVELSHFPYAGDTQGTDRHVEHRPLDQGRWLLHGHVHGLWRQRDRQINVGIDAWGGRPVSSAAIEALISAGPAHHAPLAWS